MGFNYGLKPNGMVKKDAITHRLLQRKMGEYDALKTAIEALGV